MSESGRLAGARIVDDGEDAAEVRAARSLARARYNAALRLVRRAHLYAGLFMIPWVFLYAVTAFLFNHPGAFPDREAVAFGPADSAGTSLGGFAPPSELASRVVEGLNKAGEGPEGRPMLRLTHPESARYSRDLIATATGRGREHSVRIDLETGSGTVLSTAAAGDPSAASPGEVRLDLPDPPRARLVAGIAQLLAGRDFSTDTVSLRNPPDLVFSAESEGKLWRVAYNLQTGLTTRRPLVASGEKPSTRRFLTGLHLAREYPSRWGVRWFWAVAVDAMFATMVFWGGSGLLMWWQMKSTRRWGIAVLLASAVVATALAIGMHSVPAS